MRAATHMQKMYANLDELINWYLKNVYGIYNGSSCIYNFKTKNNNVTYTYILP